MSENISIYFENEFFKKCSFTDVDMKNGDELIDEIIKAINKWISQNNYNDIYDQAYQVNRFNVNDMIKIRIDNKYESSLFSFHFLKSDDPHEVEIVKITDSKIFIGQSCSFQRGEKTSSSFNFLIDSIEFHIVACWDGTLPKASASNKSKNTTFIVVDVFEELLNKEFYNNQILKELENIKSKDGIPYKYPVSAERSNLYPSILTVECGASFKSTVNFVNYEKYKSIHDFDSNNIGFLKKNKDNLYSYPIDRLFSEFNLESIDRKINELKELKKKCSDHMDKKEIDQEFKNSLELFSEIPQFDDLNSYLTKNIDIISQKINMEMKRKKILSKFFNVKQLYLFKVQNFQVPATSVDKGNYVKPRVIEMMPLGFMAFLNDIN